MPNIKSRNAEVCKCLEDAPHIRKIVLAGNPNVGKSTVFNALTGMKQHTGNWAGKTVELAAGSCTYNKNEYSFVDIPGTYSLMAHSREEKVASDYVCGGEADCVVVVADATCLERNLNLVLQIVEASRRTVLCVNLMDEAAKKGIYIDLKRLEELLGIPVVSAAARSGKGLDKLMEKIEYSVEKAPENVIAIRYTAAIEGSVAAVSEALSEVIANPAERRHLALRLLENRSDFLLKLKNLAQTDDIERRITDIISEQQKSLSDCGISAEKLCDNIISCIILTAEGICAECVSFKKRGYDRRDRRIDRILTDKRSGIPIMLVFFLLIFWITITGANYPSALLSELFAFIGGKLSSLAISANFPTWLSGILIDGIYTVLTWVIAVMLPPMAIFFPLFTILEDFGYLPRIAFNLDRFFKKSAACGKQALTIAMGIGCNACGVTGARIIDSPRERLIAIVTNVFTPCNGRFPTIIAIISMFIIGLNSNGFLGGAASALVLTLVIVFSVMMTLFISKLLSKTLLKGVPSSFTLELPPYRRPQFLKVLVRAVLDRVVFVLLRAVAVAAPAGAIIWLFANITVGDGTLLSVCSDFLDPFGRLLGLDGVIVFAFILGFPANETVLPIVIMSYTAAGTLGDYSSLSELKMLLADNGWTIVTAISMILMTIMHFPCSTTCLTIYKETKSVKWTALSMLIPTACGIVVCMAFANIARLFTA